MKGLVSTLLACMTSVMVSAAEWTPKFYEGLEANGTVTTVPNGYKGQESCLELKHLSGGFKFGAEKAVDSGLTGPVDWTVSVEFACFDGGEAQVGMEFFGADGRLIAAKLGVTAKGTDWTRREWKFHAGPKVAKVTVQLLSLAAGGVRFAHFKATPVSGADSEIALDVRCYPIGCTADWNGGKAVFNSFSDAPLPLAFHFKGERTALKEPAFELDLPAELDVVDAFTAHSGCHRAETPTVTELVRDGGAYRRFRFTRMNVFQILQTGYGWGRELALVIEPRAGVKVPSRFQAFFRTADGQRSGEEQAFEISFTELPTQFRRPKNFPVHCWGDWDRLITKDDVLSRTVRAWEAAGCLSFHRVSSTFARGQEIVRFLKARKTGWFFPGGFADLWHERFLGGEGYKALGKNVRKVKTVEGTMRDEKICPDYFNNDPAFRAYYEQRITGSLKGMEDGDWVTLDFEPWGSATYCVCDTCLGKFAAFAGLTEPPAPKDITGKYRDTWAQFRCGQCEDTIRMTCEIIRRCNPKLVICDYDYIQMYGSGKEYLFFRGCAKDTKRNEKWFDRHLCSYYHVHDLKAFAAISNNTHFLEKPYIPVASNDGAGTYLSKAEVRHPRQLRQLALAAFVFGCPGFSIYEGTCFDGAQLFALMKARDEIAALEDLPWGKTKGSLRAEASDDQLVFTTTAKGGREVIALFNYNRKAAVTVFVKSDVLRTGHALVDPVTGEKLVDHADLRKGFEVSVPKDGVKFMELVR